MKKYSNFIYNYPLAAGESFTYYNVANDDLVAVNQTFAAETG